MFIGIIVALMRLSGRVKAIGFSKRRLKKLMKKTGKGVVFVSNHPSMTETFILPGMFFPEFLFSRMMMPISTPDKRFFNAGWFSLIRPACLSVDRSSSIAGGKLILSMISILKERGMLILFGEGGRTYRESDPDKIKTLGSNKIRHFKEGIDKVFERGLPIIIPIWAEGGERIIPNVDYDGERRWLPFPRLWRKMTLRFGEPVLFEDVGKEKFISKLEDMVLGLSALKA